MSNNTNLNISEMEAYYRKMEALCKQLDAATDKAEKYRVFDEEIALHNEFNEKFMQNT